MVFKSRFAAELFNFSGSQMMMILYFPECDFSANFSNTLEASLAPIINDFLLALILDAQFLNKGKGFLSRNSLNSKR